jgi:hypothetical protein
MPKSYVPVARFERATGARVNTVMYYSGWYEGFQTAFADEAQSHGATVLVNMDSSGAPLSGIAVGKYDSYLARFGREVRSFGHPVIVSFDHEMNGSWFDYGFRHASPTQFVSAWRHVHQVIDSQTNLVTWLWTVNVPAGNRTEQLAAIYPGSEYVDLIGVDGYDWSGTLSFDRLFGNALKDVKAVDPSKHILIAETSVEPGTNSASQVAGLFDGIKANDLLGFVWFNVDNRYAQHTSDHHDWRLQNDPAGLASFKKAATG